MKILIPFLVAGLSHVTLHAQGVWTEENIDPNTGLRTGVVEVDGSSFTIGPEADLSNARLIGVDLSGANLSGANLSNATLSEANLEGANLMSANLREGFFWFANLSGAELSFTDLSGARFLGAVMTEALLRGVQLSEDTRLAGADLRGAVFSSSVVNDAHIGPLITAFSSRNYDEIETVKSQVETNTTEIEAIKAQLATLVDALAAKDEQIEQQGLRIAEIEGQRDARPTQAQLTAVEEERDELSADIQLVFDLVNAAAGRADADLVAVVDPENAPLETQSVGVIAQALEAFEVNTFDSPNNLDTELGLYDADGNLVRRNDDAFGLQSQLNFSDGLARGVYYLAVGTFNSTFGAAEFEVSSTGQGGDYTLTLPTGPVSGTLEASGFDWYCIEIGTNFAALQLQPLTEIYSDLVEANTFAISERDAAISERDARPTLAEVQDARPGSLVFRADEETNSVTLEFEIQSSENLQDWVAQPEKVTATVPLDAEKKFVRIALAQE